MWHPVPPHVLTKMGKTSSAKLTISTSTIVELSITLLWHADNIEAAKNVMKMCTLTEKYALLVNISYAQNSQSDWRFH